MYIKISGKPDDLIKRCDTCDHCIFEDILSNEQRKIKVLKQKIPKNHVHRGVIEQLCGRNYDNVCPMKYVAMRSTIDDRTVMQMAVIENYLQYLGKKFKKKVEFEQALAEWGKTQDLGRGKVESYARRYDYIWKKGMRIIKNSYGTIEKQIFTSDFIYEMVMAKPCMYENIITLLKIMIKEYNKREEL